MNLADAVAPDQYTDVEENEIDDDDSTVDPLLNIIVTFDRTEEEQQNNRLGVYMDFNDDIAMDGLEDIENANTYRNDDNDDDDDDDDAYYEWMMEECERLDAYTNMTREPWISLFEPRMIGEDVVSQEQHPRCQEGKHMAEAWNEVFESDSIADSLVQTRKRFGLDEANVTTEESPTAPNRGGFCMQQ